jgi:Flp pilus assembly protein TadG
MTMSRTRRTRRKPDDRGAVTVEAAAAMATFAVVLGLSICGLMAAADQVRCVDAAREAARLAARGEPEQAKQAAARIAPANAKITITKNGEHIEVDIYATPAKGLLPGLELHEEAFAVSEPGIPG